MVLHLPDQIKNWGPATAWWCFPYERRIEELSDMQTSGKSVEEQIFNHFFLQLCVYHSPDPLPPCSLNEHLAPAFRTVLETKSSDCTIDSLQAAGFGRVAEDFFTGRSKVIHSSKIVVNDPFCFLEKDFFPTHWPVVLLPPFNFLFSKILKCTSRNYTMMNSSPWSHELTYLPDSRSTGQYFHPSSIGQTVKVLFFLIVWTPIIEEAKRLGRSFQLLTFSFKPKCTFLGVVVLEERCTVWLSWNGIDLLIPNILLTSCQVLMLCRVPIIKEIILSMLDA